MNSLLDGGEYRLYDSSETTNNFFKRFSLKNEHRPSNNNFSRQLLPIVWAAIRYHFYHDLSFFAVYFQLIIERKSFCRRLSFLLQLLTLYYIAFYTGLGLFSSVMPAWAHLLTADVFHLLGLAPVNYAWLVAILAICLPCTRFLLTGNSGSTSVLLYRLLVQGDSGDFLHPLVVSLAATGNAHFKRYLGYHPEEEGKSLFRRRWGRKKPDRNGRRLEDTTWAQYHQAFAVKMRNGLQMYKVATCT